MQCNACMIYFRDNDALEKHMDETHKEQSLYVKCNLCGQDLDGELNEHIKREHMESSVFEEEQKEQQHCSLNTRGSTECSFQCNSKEAFERHVNKKHSLTCTVCPQQFTHINELAEHMGKDHKENIDTTHNNTSVTCNQCGIVLQSKREMPVHLYEAHKTYKPCTKYNKNSCDPEHCRFYHIKLQANQSICFKCPSIFESKTDLFNHIKVQHSDIECHKFLQNKCDRNSDECIFSHKTNPAKSSPPPQEQVFQEGPITQAQTRAVGMPTMSEHIQNKQHLNRTQMNSQTPVHIINMIPQIVAQVIAVLTRNTL